MRRKMQRTGSLALAVFLTCLLTVIVSGPAFASTATTTPNQSVQTRHVTQTSTQVQSYWTSARLKAARPMSNPVIRVSTSPSAKTNVANLDGGVPASHAPVRPKNNGIRADAVPLPTSIYDTYPYTTIGRIFFSDSSGNGYSCSGTSIASNNKNVVDTAGHCVIARGSGNQWYGNWLFCPHYYYGQSSVGCWSGRQAWASNDWIYNGSIEDDFGEIVVWPNAYGNLTDVVGSAGWAYNYSVNQFFDAFGYPAEGAFNGQSIYYCYGTGTGYSYDDGTLAEIPCDMTGGSSGGPWLISVNGNFGYVNGHNDWVNNVSAPTQMYSPYYDGDWYNVFNSAQNVF